MRNAGQRFPHATRYAAADPSLPEQRSGTPCFLAAAWQGIAAAAHRSPAGWRRSEAACRLPPAYRNPPVLSRRLPMGRFHETSRPLPAGRKRPATESGLPARRGLPASSLPALPAGSEHAHPTASGPGPAPGLASDPEPGSGCRRAARCFQPPEQGFAATGCCSPAGRLR